MNVELGLSILSSCLAVLGFIWTYVKVIMHIEHRLAKLENFDFTSMFERLVTMETKMELFWKAVEGSAISMLHHPTTQRKDELLERFPGLDSKEVCELREILHQEMHKLKVSQDPKLLAYALMIARIDSELLDRKAREACKGER